MKAYGGRSKIEKDEASVSKKEAMILRKVEILCRFASKIGHVTVNGRLDVMHTASFGPNVFQGVMR